MLVITNIETKQLTPDYISLEWTIQSTEESLSDYRLYIWKSGLDTSNISDYERLTSGLNPQVIGTYNDSTVYGATSKTVDYFYRIQMSGLIAPYDSLFSSPYYISVRQDKYAREIERRRHIVFTKHSGQPFFLLKRRSYGTFCTNCYDATLQRTTMSKCPVCYDTGFMGGFFGPTDVIGQLMERPVREIHQLFGAWQDQDSALYCEALPSMNPKDIIIDRLSRRWIVLNVGSYSKGTHSIGQIIQLRQIEKEDITYTFPITY